MVRVLALAAVGVALAAAPAHAVSSPTPTPGSSEGLHIRNVTVDIRPIQLAPGLPATVPAGSHIEQPPAQTPFRSVPLGGQQLEPLRGFSAPARPMAAPRRPRPSPSPTTNP